MSAGKTFSQRQSVRERPASVRGSGEPEFILPCLPQTVELPPTGAVWVHEIKYDGYRVEALYANGHARLLTRNGLDWSSRFGRLVDAFQDLKIHSAVIDGEAIVSNDAGISDFAALTRMMKRPGSTGIVFMAFDLLLVNGTDLRSLPLVERKAALLDLLADLPKTNAIRYSEHMKGDGQAILRNACAIHLEGIVSKRTDLPYRSGRLGDWTKAKCVLADPFVIIGVTPSKAANETVGSLVVGYFHGSSLTYAGRVGSGFSHQDAVALWDGLKKIRTTAPPWAKTLTKEQRDGVMWIEPRVVAQVSYAGWTRDGILRHATLRHFRDDKLPTEIGQPASLAIPVPPNH